MLLFIWREIYLAGNLFGGKFIWREMRVSAEAALQTIAEQTVAALSAAVGTHLHQNHNGKSASKKKNKRRAGKPPPPA
jgi:hypothetical protein